MYRIYPKYWDILTKYHTCPKFLTPVYHLLMGLKIAGWVANSVDPDQMLLFAASDLGIHFLLRSSYMST